MLLKEVKMTEGEVFITPKNKEDLPLFKHCNGGREFCSPIAFKNNIEPVLQAHIHGWGKRLPIEALSKYQPSKTTRESEEELRKHFGG